MAGDVATFSAKFGIKDTIGSDLSRIKATAQAEMALLEKVLTDPIAKADREMAALVKTTEKLGDKAFRGGLFSERQLQDIERLQTRLESIGRLISNISGGTPGYGQTATNLHSMQSVVGMASQLAIRSPGVNDPGYLPLSSKPTQFSGMGIGQYQNWRESVNEERLQRNIAWNRQADSYGRSSSYPGGLGGPMDSNGYVRPNRGVMGAAGAAAELEDRIARHSSTVGPSPYGPQRPTEIQQTRQYNDETKRLISSHREEAEVLKTLKDQYHGLTQAQRTVMHSEASMLKGQGRPGYGLTLKALEGVEEDRRMGLGKGSYSHAFRYGSQNAAFALEDFMISSQYGGFKAGMRAITNNLTAMTSAATMSMNPLAAAGIIGAVAVAGAGAPVAYDYFASKFGNSEEDIKRRDMMFARESRMRDDRASNIIFSDRAGSSYSAQSSKAKSMNDEYLQLQNRMADRGKRAKQFERGERQAIEDDNVHWIETAAVYAGYGVGQMTNPNNRFTNRVVAWERSKQDRAEMRKLKEEELKDSDPIEKLKELTKQNNATTAAREYEDRRFRESLPLSKELVGLQKREMLGEILNPRLKFAATTKLEHAEYLSKFNAPGMTSEDKLRLTQQYQQHNEGRYQQFEADDQAFGLRLRDRGWQHRGRMADLEINPVKKLNAQFDLQRDQILADKSFLNEGDRTAELAALEKNRKLSLRDLGQYPGLGNAINVGSADDLRLRQRNFDRTGESGRSTESERKLGEIVEEIRRLRDDVKATKPSSKGVKKS